MRKLVFFSRSYPYSYAYDWKAGELSELRKYFDDIIVAPFVAESGTIASDFPRGIRLAPPALKQEDLSHRTSSAGRILNGRFLTHARALIGMGNTEFFVGARRWLHNSLTIEKLLKSEVFQRQIVPELSSSCLYFYWGAGYAAILPFLDKHLQRASMVRFHRYDLYWDANGYIPSQRSIVESAGMVATVSEHGANFLRQSYPSHAKKIRCFRLGTTISGKARPSSDGVLRLVSCAFVNPVKRLNMIVESLRHIDRPTEWTHIGDGPLLSSLIDQSRQLPAHVICNFVGRLEMYDVRKYYDGRHFDVFINVSESEGIPVSIMEAMAAEIPVVATNVGGTSELVDDSVGRLLPVHFTPADFVSKLNELTKLDIATRDAYRAQMP